MKLALALLLPFLASFSSPDAGPPADTEKPDTAFIGINGPFNKDMAEQFVSAMAKSQKMEIKNIIIKINSPGGEVGAGWRMINALEASHAHIVCIADQFAQSMAYAFLQSCPVRIMTQRATLMTHRMYFEGIDKLPAEVQEEIKEAIKIENEGFASQCQHRLKMSLDDYKKKIAKKSWFMSAGEALKVGAVDHVAPTIDDALQIASMILFTWDTMPPESK